MSKNNLYKYVQGSTYTLTETYTDVGSETFILGYIKRAFTDVGIKSGETDLIEGVDFTRENPDQYYIDKEGVNVYTGIKIINESYVTGALEITYEALGSYTDPASFQGVSFVGDQRWIDPNVDVPENFVALDGQLINDIESVQYNGKRVFNMNGADVVLTLTWTADAGGAYADVSLDDLDALSERDDVSGTGIASGAIITSINLTTGRVIIDDVDATGSIETTFTNEGLPVTGSSVAGSCRDEGQRITGVMDSFANSVTKFNMLNTTRANDMSGAFTISPANTTASNMSSSAANIGIAADCRGFRFSSAGSPDARSSSTTKGRTKTQTRYLKAILRIK